MNKNHTITANNRTFYTAQVVDAYDNKTHDQTIIFEEPADHRLPPRVVNYYYGEPDERLTKEYVEGWLNDQDSHEKCYANCVGYALHQCYSSGIEITRPIESDEQHLAMIKELAKEYEVACDLLYDESKLEWQISAESLRKIKDATTLAELYN